MAKNVMLSLIATSKGSKFIARVRLKTTGQLFYLYVHYGKPRCFYAGGDKSGEEFLDFGA
jgi:hypothetical protein